MSTDRVNGLGRWLFVGFGIFLGFFFLYLAFRDISWAQFVEGLSELNPIFLLPAAVLIIVIQIVRALRFALIVSPFCKLGLRDSWDLINIWGGLNMIMPARLGELVRPYLLRKRGASFPSTLGAVMVERFFDVSGLVLLLGVVLWKTPQVPPTYSVLGQIVLAALAIGYLLVLAVLTRREQVRRLVDRLLSWFPARIGTFVGKMFNSLVDGLGIMASMKQAVIIFVYSVVIWLLFSAITYLFLLAFSLEVPFLVAVTTQVLLCLGVALPSAPGFIGTFHAAGRYSLALFGIKATIAVPFATVYHLFSLSLSILLGVISYLTGSFRLERQMLHTKSADPVAADDGLVADKSAG